MNKYQLIVTENELNLLHGMLVHTLKKVDFFFDRSGAKPIIEDLCLKCDKAVKHG